MKPKISLTCIAGNAEKYIEKFLDQFQPFVDEVVIVRAIGNNLSDKTLSIARARGCTFNEYRNKEKFSLWPHVDNFAAARNVAASMATGDWIMWADMDDELQDGERIRELIEAAHADQWMISCPYVVSEQGIAHNFRERLWRNNGKCKWVNAIHENLVPTVEMPRPVMKTDAFRIIHAPSDDRECTKDRNFRILESVPAEDRTIAHRFYYAQELIRRNDPRAVEEAKAFLADPESATPERFEMMMGLAQVCEDYAAKAGIYLQALGEDPTRPEALYELASLSLACEQPRNAMAYAEMMMLAKWPENPAWNQRAMFYGFWRDDLYWQCVRSTGDERRADTMRRNAALRTGLPIISLIHATRGRPYEATRARKAWLAAANHPHRVEHIFGCDLDDESSHVLNRFRCTWNPAGGGPVAAWNVAAFASAGDVLVQMSDDWNPSPGWDDAIIEAIGDLSKPSVLAINDGHRKDDLLCMAIMTRARYNQQGHMFHPDFFSMFSDNWFSECAFRDGVVIDARDRITFEHVHPAFGKAPLDETYARTNAAEHYQSGMETLERLRNQ